MSRAQELIDYLEKKIESAMESGKSHTEHGTKDRSHKCTIRITVAREIIGELRRLDIRREVQPKMAPQKRPSLRCDKCGRMDPDTGPTGRHLLRCGEKYSAVDPGCDGRMMLSDVHAGRDG